jgi:anti-sigma regulatory factor (Ser/Thr protein kinase)
MRTGVAAGHVGYYHEAACFGSDEELIATAVPFLAGGVAAGEPTVVSMGERNADLLRAALPSDAGVTFLTGDSIYARPAGAIRAYRNLLADHVAAGAEQIRVIGELSPTTHGATWDWWARYESAINHAYHEFPMWSICAYDTRVTPEPVLADVLRTHPRRALPGGRHATNETYTDPVQYLTEPRTPVPDPLQSGPPLVELSEPSAAQARKAVRDADRGVLPPESMEDLVLAVSEAVGNTCRHGRSPRRMRLWHGGDRIVVSVTDAGPGPRDPYAGLLPAGDSPEGGGLGLWIMHQMCDHVVMYHGPDGFTVRLTAGNPEH